MDNKIFNATKASLDKSEINYRTEENLFVFNMQMDHANFETRVYCEEEMELLLVSVSTSFIIPQDKIDRMCRWVADKNYNLTFGHFVLDTKEGNLYFRITCPVDGGAMNEEIAYVAISNALGTFDNSFEDIVKTLYLEGGSGDN